MRRHTASSVSFTVGICTNGRFQKRRPAASTNTCPGRLGNGMWRVEEEELEDEDTFFLVAFSFGMMACFYTRFIKIKDGPHSAVLSCSAKTSLMDPSDEMLYCMMSGKLFLRYSCTVLFKLVHLVNMVKYLRLYTP